MKLAVAQIKPVKGQINENIEIHKKLIHQAVSEAVDLIVFSELSLTGYEPELASGLAMDYQDHRLDGFQKLSDEHQIAIGVGIPMKTTRGIQISMVFFKSDQPRQVYSKQHLHTDEYPYFVYGKAQLLFTIKNKKIAPAICYESLLEEHIAKAKLMGAEIYIASVAKPEKGVHKALNHFRMIAKKYNMTVLMSNSIGHCDNFESAGRTAAWNSKGVLINQLDDHSEGLVVINLEQD